MAGSARRPPFDVGSAQQGWTFVNAKQIAAVADFANSSDLVFAFMNKITSSIERGGMSVKLLEFDKEVELDQEHVDYVSRKWLQFRRRLSDYAWLIGVVPVLLVEDPDNPGEQYPYVPPWTSWSLKFYERSDGGPRRYAVTYNDHDYGTLSGGPARDDPSHLQDNPNNRGFQLLTGERHNLVFEIFPPDERGNLGSPLSRLARGLSLLDRALSNNDYAGYWRARPLHSIEVSKNVVQEAIEGARPQVDYVADGDVRGEAEGALYRRTAQEQRSFEMSQEALRRTQMPIVAASGASRASDDASLRARVPASPATAALPNPNALVSPLEHQIQPGPNQTLRPGPVPQQHPDFAATIDHVVRIACATLDVPPSILSEAIAQGTADRTATGTSASVKAFDRKIQADKERLGAILTTVYAACYAGEHAKYVRRAVREARDRLAADEAGEDAAAAEDDGEEGDERDEEEEEAPPRPGSARDAAKTVERLGESRKRASAPERSLTRAPKRGLRQLVRRSIRPIVSLQHTPEVALADISMLQSQMVITEDYAHKLAGAAANIPADEILTGAKLEAEKKKRHREGMQEREDNLALEKHYEIKAKKPGEAATPGEKAADKRLKASGFGKA